MPFTFFLLSILSQLQLAPGAVPIDIPCPPSFNSFPVAAVDEKVPVEKFERYVVAFNSFPVAASVVKTR